MTQLERDIADLRRSTERQIACLRACEGLSLEELKDGVVSRGQGLTVPPLWDCAEALLALADLKDNKYMYRATGEYQARKLEVWEAAEEALKNAGLMEVIE